jgi:hypothetical protein
MAKVWLLFAAVGFLAGCIVGDGVFGVTGILSPTARSCEMLLLSEKGTEVPFTRKRVQGSFRLDFVVNPYARVYDVALDCDGRIQKVRTVRYGTEVEPGQWVSLGEIAL